MADKTQRGPGGSDAAVLSSIATALEELTARVTAVADEHAKSPDESVAVDLYDVERALRAANRRLAKVRDRL